MTLQVLSCYRVTTWMIGMLLLFHFTDVVEPTDGDWSDWSVVVSKCTKLCGNGTTTKVRTCNNPKPTPDGAKCLDSQNNEAEKEYVNSICNTQPCWVTDDWSNYTNCDGNCSKGTQTRHALCGGAECEGEQEQKEVIDCNTWDRETCDSPCLKIDAERSCPEFASCVDESTDEEPSYRCGCLMGYVMSTDGKTCIRPPPAKPTPRPIPTLAPEEKVVATVISKTASTVLIICVSICLVIFIVLRIFTIDRVIQMNMEIALLLAHVFLMFPSTITETEDFCRAVSILIHFFFTACFMFMFLEALHMYGYIAYVVKSEGMCSKVQYILMGWGVSAIVVIFCMCFEYHDYGAPYHCWLQMNTPLLYGQLIPIIGLVILTFTLIEAAGAADYKQLKDLDNIQLGSAKFSQRTNLILLPLVFSHMLVGMFSEYEQNLPLYGIFTILCSVTGVAVLLLHCVNNHQVRSKMMGIYKSMCGKK
ncbi:hypothetical protein Pcinc_032891 [Petrolisthes cinctipes]|uniref:G-protein coupled receptors family 2 profile 2 domain-containing protein n=1 Tax=Petrolisthes cinctipes TaxID=88211 RepID=A0AAE1JYF6_PETCI|nr:hypothetical protein Pcinc_032891 [Petrolisthes cinctipes]